MFLAVRNPFARSVLLALLICTFLLQPLGPLSALVPPPAVALAQSIPSLALWQSNMLTFGSQHCVLGTLDQVYYDAERVYYQIADYTRDPSWLTCSQLRSEEHTSELQSLAYLVCRLLLEKKK